MCKAYKSVQQVYLQNVQKTYSTQSNNSHLQIYHLWRERKEEEIGFFKHISGNWTFFRKKEGMEYRNIMWDEGIKQYHQATFFKFVFILECLT